MGTQKDPIFGSDIKKEVDISAAKEEQVHKSSGQIAPVVSLRQFGRF
jgi:hypothetical protein